MVAVLSSGLLGDVADGNRLIETIQLPAALYLPHNTLLTSPHRRKTTELNIFNSHMLNVEGNLVHVIHRNDSKFVSSIYCWVWCLIHQVLHYKESPQ